MGGRFTASKSFHDLSAWQGFCSDCDHFAGSTLVSREGPRFEGVIWDGHSGILFDDTVEPTYLQRYIDSGVTLLTLNVGSDVSPWSSIIHNLSVYRAAVAARPNQCVIVHNEKDIRQAKTDGKLAIVFDIEGMSALNGSLEMLDLYYDLGVRQMTLTYNRNNAAAAGCHDEDQGLTKFGRDIVHKMDRLGIMIDCSHVSFTSSMEAIQLSENPVVFSHSNCKSIYGHERNICDEQIIACAAKGGVSGVTGLGIFLGTSHASVDELVRHIDHKVDLVGPMSVGIGLDYFPDSGGLASTWNPVYWPTSQYPNGPSLGFMDPEAFPRIADTLSMRGYSDRDVHGIMGENFLRVANQVWK
ncbi:membrane dipeptidase [Mesorhizobium shonense]|uniref:Membrane dipeptidase n=1 Tax=Mesorhizobium shonense TaxID=1209948 RepID=A0ABV2HWT3_9HYPH